MLNMNRKISRDMSYTDTMWLERSELKIDKVFKRQISKRRKVLIEVMCGLYKKRSHEINKLEDKKENVFWRTKKSR